MSAVRNRLNGEPPHGMGSLYPGTGNFTPIVGKRDSRRRTRAIQKHRRPFLPSVCLNPADVKSLCINFSHHRNFRAKNLAAVMITDTFLFQKPNCHQQETFRKHWITAAWGRCPRAAPGRPASGGGHQIKRRRPLHPAASDGLPVHNRNNAVPSPCQMQDGLVPLWGTCPMRR